MVVTAWNNGKYHQSGSGYGLKLTIADRDHYFNRIWRRVLLQLQGEAGYVSVNLNKSSFWTPKCRELISKDVGVWLIKNKKAPWSKGHPPKIAMEHTGQNKFKVTFIN